MTKEQEVLQQFLTKRVELLRSTEQLQSQLQLHSEVLLRVEGAIEAFGLIGIVIPSGEGPAPAVTPE